MSRLNSHLFYLRLKTTPHLISCVISGGSTCPEAPSSKVLIEVVISSVPIVAVNSHCQVTLGNKGEICTACTCTTFTTCVM